MLTWYLKIDMNIEFKSLDKDNLYPPVPATQVIPERFKKIPNTNTEYDLMTVKNCMPMIEHLSNGYAIRLRHSIDIKQKFQPYAEGFDERNTFTVGQVGLGNHPHEQLPITINGKRNDYIKLPNLWTIKTPDGYSSMFYSVFGEERFKIFSGVVATDKYTLPVLFPGVITTTEDFTIEAGTAIAIVFPFKRDSWTSTTTEWSVDNKIQEMEDMRTFNENAHHYKNSVHVKSKFN